MNRREILEVVGPQLEPPIWRLFNTIRDTLLGLSKVPHFDLADDSAVASAIHSAVPAALDEHTETKLPLIHRFCPKGPGNKIVAHIQIEGRSQEICMELHLAGPKGGTRKKDHQFAGISDPEQRELWENVSEFDAPESLLCFVAYRLSETRTKIQDAWLVFADGNGREKIKLRNTESETFVAEGNSPQSTEFKSVGSTMKVKPSAKRPHDEQRKDQWEEDTSGA